MSEISNNIKILQEAIRVCAKKFNRAHDVTLLAVSKNQPVENILEAINAGQYAFGENYLQEALPKIHFFSNASHQDFKKITWHFIGSIQNNKTKKIAEHFSWVHSLSSAKTAHRLNEQRPPFLPPLNICIEVNISDETSKEGLSIEEVLDLAKECLTLPRLKLRGLMAIPAPRKTFEEQCQQFRILKNLFDHLFTQGIMLDTLSMGMSDDWEAAIAEGSTMIRIGTAIFGKRN